MGWRRVLKKLVNGCGEWLIGMVAGNGCGNWKFYGGWVGIVGVRVGVNGF